MSNFSYKRKPYKMTSDGKTKTYKNYKDYADDYMKVMQKKYPTYKGF